MGNGGALSGVFSETDMVLPLSENRCLSHEF